MSENVHTIDRESSANAAWTLMRRHRIRHLVVTERGELVGILSERDLGGKYGVETRRGRKVDDLMTGRIATADPNMTLREAANLMRGRLIGSLPVLEDGRLVGMVTATDILDAMGRGSSRPEGLRRRPPTGKQSATRKRAEGPEVKIKRVRESQGRQRNRTPGSEERAPFAAEISRPIRTASGRTGPSLIPAHIIQNLQKSDRLNDFDESYIRRKLGMKLGKFADAIERVTVRLKDVNGPKGGVDKRCRIKIVISGLPSLLIEEQGESLNAVIDLALSRAENVIRHRLQRRRTISRNHPLSKGAIH